MMSVRLALLAVLALWVSSCQKTVIPLQGYAEPDLTAVPERYRPLFKGGMGEEEHQAFQKELPYKSITLARTGNPWERSASYEITLNRDGTAEWKVAGTSPNTGLRKGKIDLFSYGRLCCLLERLEFEDMKDSYDANWTDDETVAITVTTDTRKKTVSEYGGTGPIELWAIQQTIERLREKIKWGSAEK